MSEIVVKCNLPIMSLLHDNEKGNGLFIPPPHKWSKSHGAHKLGIYVTNELSLGLLFLDFKMDSYDLKYLVTLD